MLYIYIGCSLVWAALTIAKFSGFNIPLWRQTTYNNPFTWSASIAFFLLFTTIEFQSKWINYLAKSALAVYLFGFPMSQYLPSLWFDALYGIPYIVVAAVWTFFRFGVAVSLDQVRKLCMIPIDYIWNRTLAKYIQ